MNAEAIKKAVAQFFESLGKMDIEACVRSFDENAAIYDPAAAPPIQGHEALRRFFQEMAKIFEEVDLRENHVFISGNGAAIKWTGTGVGRNGREVKFEGIDVIEMNEKGRIQKLWAYWQPEALMIQLQQ